MGPDADSWYGAEVRQPLRRVWRPGVPGVKRRACEDVAWKKWLTRSFVAPGARAALAVRGVVVRIGSDQANALGWSPSTTLYGSELQPCDPDRPARTLNVERAGIHVATP